MRDLVSKIDAAVAMIAAAITATKSDNPIIDLKGRGSAVLLFGAGAVSTADSSNYFAATIVHGNNSALSDGATVSAADLIVRLPNGETLPGAAAPKIDNTADANKLLGMIGYRGNKRYLRFVPAETGTADAVVWAQWVFGDLEQSPPAAT